MRFFAIEPSSIKGYLSAGYIGEPACKIEKGRFTCSIRADYSKNLSLANRKGHISDSPQATFVEAIIFALFLIILYFKPTGLFGLESE